MNYSVDANGSMTSDGLREYDYDASGRLAKVRIVRNGEAASVRYLHNALGQRVFKGQPQVEQTAPSEDELGAAFVNWLKKNFGWLFVPSKETLSGEAFVYADGAIPSWALLGQYDVRTATARNTAEYIWLPTEDGSAIPIGMYKGGELYAIHADHLGTPRLITDRSNKPVWQWPHSGAFGGNPPVGLLATTASAGQISTRATKPRTDVHLRFPGQYWDEETNLVYNRFRTYDGQVRGGYVQADPIGLAGGLNRLGYANQSPLMLTDPEGLQVPFPPGGGAAGGVGGFGGIGGFGGSAAGLPGRPVDPTDPNGPQYSPAPGMAVPNLIKDILNRVCPPEENECDKLNDDVRRAKDKVGRFQPAACSPGMSKAELAARASAWLELAVARSKRDQKCWAGGDAGHQQAQADAWANLGRCQRLLR